MSDEKIQGKVKWYSIRKGWGFITPSSDNAPTKEDIFFHQTAIVSDVKNKRLVRLLFSFCWNQYWFYVSSIRENPIHGLGIFC